MKPGTKRKARAMKLVQEGKLPEPHDMTVSEMRAKKHAQETGHPCIWNATNWVCCHVPSCTGNGKLYDAAMNVAVESKE